MTAIDDDVPLPSALLSAASKVPMPETFTISQAKTLLNCGHSSIYKLAGQGDIVIIKVLGKSLIVGLREFIERKVTEARQPNVVN